MQALSRSTKNIDKLHAISLFSEILRDDNFLKLALRGLCLTYYSMRDFDKARQYAEDLLRSDPDNAENEALHAAVKFQHQQQKHNDLLRSSVGMAVGIGAIAGIFLYLKRK